VFPAQLRVMRAAVTTGVAGNRSGPANQDTIVSTNMHVFFAAILLSAIGAAVYVSARVFIDGSGAANHRRPTIATRPAPSTIIPCDWDIAPVHRSVPGIRPVVQIRNYPALSARLGFEILHGDLRGL
jgi:hypothetical protein